MGAVALRRAVVGDAHAQPAVSHWHQREGRQSMNQRREQQLWKDLSRMLAIGISRGYTVEECLQTVRVQSRLESGRYDAEWTPGSDSAHLFRKRRGAPRHPR